MFKKIAQEILKKATKGKGKPKPKPKLKKKTQAGAQSRKGGQTSPTTGQKVALGVAAAGSGALLGLKLKEDKGARAGGMQQGQSPKGGTAPKKKPKQIKNLPDARDKAKTRPQAKPGKFVKYSKGFVRDKTGKKIKRLSREEVMKRRKAQR